MKTEVRLVRIKVVLMEMAAGLVELKGGGVMVVVALKLGLGGEGGGVGRDGGGPSEDGRRWRFGLVVVIRGGVV